MANNSTVNPQALRKGAQITTTVPEYAKRDPKKRYWCSRPNCCASVTAKRDMNRHYRDNHPERLDANGKVRAAEVASWVNEQYLNSGLATDEEIAAAAAANGALDSEEEEDEEEVEEIMEQIEEDDDENDEGEDEDEDGENEGDENDDDEDDEDEDEDMEVDEEDDDSEEEEEEEEEEDEANDSEDTEGPTNPAYTSVQLLLRAANLRFAAWELLREGSRVQAAAVEEEAVEWEAEGLVVRGLEEAGLRVPWDFGPAVEQAAMGGPGVMAKGEYGV